MNKCVKDDCCFYVFMIKKIIQFYIYQLYQVDLDIYCCANIAGICLGSVAVLAAIIYNIYYSVSLSNRTYHNYSNLRPGWYSLTYLISPGPYLIEADYCFVINTRVIFLKFWLNVYFLLKFALKIAPGCYS
jgi:hypothetical protein